MFIEWSSTFHTTFVEIGEFDWLSGRQKGSIFVKMFKNLLLRILSHPKPKKMLIFRFVGIFEYIILLMLILFLDVCQNS